LAPLNVQTVEPKRTNERTRIEIERILFVQSLVKLQRSLALIIFFEKKGVLMEDPSIENNNFVFFDFG